MREPNATEATEPNALLLQALARLNEIGASINRITGGDEVGLSATLRLIVESAVSMLPGASAVLYTCARGTRSFDPFSRVSAGEGSWQRPFAPGELPDDSPRTAGLGARALDQRRPVLSYQEPDLGINPARLAAGARVVVALPLIAADQPLGVLYVYLQEERRLSHFELLLLDNFVNQAATAVHHASSLSDVRRNLARKEDELSLLRHAGLLISSRTRLAETLEAILQMALEVTNAHYGIIRLVDRESRALVMRAIAGDRLGHPAVETLPLNATSVMGYVARRRQPLNIADVQQPPWSDIYYPLDHALEMRSELAVPLIGAGGRLEGVLNLESPQASAFSEEDSHLLQSLATQAVIAIQEVRLLDALRSLTGRLLAQPAGETLPHLTALACNLLNAGTAGLWLLDHGQPALVASYAPGDPVRLGAREGELAQRTIVTRSPVALERHGAEAGDDWAGALLVPIHSAAGDAAIGAFGVFYAVGEAESPQASEWDRKVLATLAGYAALAQENEERQSALRAAQEASAVAETFAAMGDIAANLLHHLNNKVGTIPVRVEGIQDKCAPALQENPYLAANLVEIERSALDAMETVRRRLALLRPIERSWIAVSDSVADALAASRLPGGVAVTTVELDGLPPVHAGRESLALVFQNLLENAAGAMEGSGKITITGAPRGAFVSVSVSDTGPGIAPELQSRVFDFNYSSRRRTRDPERASLGFGLWWVKTLLTRLGGTVAVESDGRAGATFDLTLPAREDSA